MLLGLGYNHKAVEMYLFLDLYIHTWRRHYEGIIAMAELYLYSVCTIYIHVHFS